MIGDPTIEEMRSLLSDADTFDREGAIYWFAADYHGGQGSNLYSALSRSQYRPGAWERRPRGLARECYAALVERYCEFDGGIDHAQAYLCEDSPAMLVLEGIVDRAGLRNVLYALEFICHAKANHLEDAWQDKQAAKVWTRNGRLCGATACKVAQEYDLTSIRA